MARLWSGKWCHSQCKCRSQERTHSSCVLTWSCWAWMILDATMGTLQRSSSVQKMKETPEEWMSLLNSRCCSSAINNYNKYKHCVYNQTCVQRVKRGRNARFVAVKFKGVIYSKGTFALKKSEREIFFTARKGSLGQGYIFTSICHSVHGDGGGGRLV